MALYDQAVHFDGDLYRNVVSLRVSRNLADDLSDDPADAALFAQAEIASKPRLPLPAINRPFEAGYGQAVLYPFVRGHWFATRFSDGGHPAWYGSLDLETTVHETVHHFRRRLIDDIGAQAHARPISGERRVYRVAADALLVDRVKLGDQRAFEMLVVKYQRRIERLIARMVRDVDLVQDIAQETFIRAYRAMPQFRGDSAFYTWLYRIAVNTAKKALVDMKRDPLVTESARASANDDDDETSRVERELTDGETPEALLATKEIAQAVNAALEALSEDLRQAITLREIEGLSYEEIAELMNCPIGTVRSRIFRAREAIALRLRPLLDTREGERW